MAKLDAWASGKFFWLTCIPLVLGLIYHHGGDTLIEYTKYILAYLMFNGALSCRMDDFYRLLKAPKQILASLFLVFLILPAFTYLLANIFLANHPLIATGVILISVLPVGVTAGVFAGLGGGSVPLAVTLACLTTLLSGFLTPFLLGIFVGSRVDFDIARMSIDLIKLLVIPVIIGVWLNEQQLPLVEKHRALLGVLTKVGIMLTMWVNAAVMSPLLGEYREGVIYALLVVALQLSICYLTGMVVARYLGMQPPEEMALGMSNAVRNVVAGVIIAINYFPVAVAIPIVVSLLLQAPVAVLIYQKYNLPGMAGGVRKAVEHS